ncbi:MAG: tail fiber protein [Alphaproteobacteria bacterium]|nr:tail fiber protein [Alphaproteobacteria bacterium]
MDLPFIGMLQAFGFSWAPRNYAQCHGQLIAISENPSLYSLLSTFYGGDGRVSFAVPEMRGRMAYGFGQLTGGLDYLIGHVHGWEDIRVDVTHMPNHSHGASFTPAGGGAMAVAASANAGSKDEPAAGDYLAKTSKGFDTYNTYTDTPGTTVPLGGVSGSGGGGTVTLATAGASDWVDIRQPVLAVGWCIALEGLYPSRN